MDRQIAAEDMAVDLEGKVVAAEVAEHHVGPRWHRTTLVVEQDEVEPAVVVVVAAAAAVAVALAEVIVAGKVVEASRVVSAPAVEAGKAVMSRQKT